MFLYIGQKHTKADGEIEAKFKVKGCSRKGTRSN